MGQEIVRELLTVLGFDLNETGFKRAEKGFKSLLGLSAELISRAERFVVGIAVRTSDAGDQAAKAAKRMGISAVDVQRLDFAMQQSGATVGDLEAGLRHLARTSFAARTGSKEAREAIGLLGPQFARTAREAKSPLDMLFALSARMTELKDPSEKAALAMKVLGRGGTALLPFLDEGPEGIARLMARADELGFVLDEKTTKAAESLNDALNEGRLAVLGLERRLGRGLMPIVQRVVDRGTKWLITNRALVDRGIRIVIDWIDKLVDAGLRLLHMVDDNRRMFIALAAVLGTMKILQSADSWLKLAAAIAKAATPAGFVLAALVILALVLEDIFVWASGGQSAIGGLFEAFLKEPPKKGEHWMITTLREIVRWIKIAMESLDSFFALFLVQAKKEGLLAALRKAPMTAVVAHTVAREQGKSIDLLTDLDMGVTGPFPGPTFGRRGPPIAEQREGRTQLPIDGPIGLFEFLSRGHPTQSIPLADFVTGQLGPSAPPAIVVAGGAPIAQQTTHVHTGTVSVTVQATTNADPQEIARETATAVEEALQKQVYEAHEDLQPMGVR